MNELITTITPMLQSLADEFGVGYEFLKANIMNYILQYGRIRMIDEIIVNIPLTIGVLVVMFLIVFMLILTIVTLFDIESVIEEKAKFIFKTVIIIAVTTIILSASTPVIKYAVSPEMYSVKAVMTDFGGKQ